MTNELYHFGVKGMKWGVRRYEDKSAQKRYTTYKKELDSINKVYDQYVQKRDFYKKQYQKNGDRHSKAEYRKYDNAVKGMDGAKEFYMKKLNSYQEEMRQLSDAQKAYHDSFYDTNELYHFGVKGMKWGQRRYQNQDGSYTSQGRGRYDSNGSSSSRSSRSSSGNNHDRLKKAAKIGAGVAAAGLAAYGGYRLAKSGKLNGLKALPNKRLALPGPKTSKVRNAASRAKSVARGAASKVGNSGVGRRVKRGVNSAQYHATRIKNEMAYRRATGGGRNVPGAAKRVAGAPVRAHKKFTNWAFTNTGSIRRNFGRGLVYGGAHGLAFDAAVVGAAVHQGRKANKRYKNANSNKRRR